jgi:hypothetical protein
MAGPIPLKELTDLWTQLTRLRVESFSGPREYGSQIRALDNRRQALEKDWITAPAGHEVVLVEIFLTGLGERYKGFRERFERDNRTALKVKHGKDGMPLITLDDAVDEACRWRDRSEGRCQTCQRTGHGADECWFAHPDLAPKAWLERREAVRQHHRHIDKS